MDRLRRLEVEALAGLIAAIAALVLHLLHIVEDAVLLPVILVILALILLRDLRREDREERQSAAIEASLGALRDIQASVVPPDTVLVGPQSLRDVARSFSQRARGEMVWFNVCLTMFEPQSLFDALLAPALDNPLVTSVQFVLDEGERGRWHGEVLPKASGHGSSGKLKEPRWGSLSDPVSAIISETDAGGTEALLSFWGEPFMARGRGQDVPRYLFHVQRHSELIGRLRELERDYRLADRPTGGTGASA
jgi:hypothetical protein